MMEAETTGLNRWLSVEYLAGQGVPQELAALPQFVGWRYGKRRPSGKYEKEPIDPRTGRKAKTDDPATWGTLPEAVSCAREMNLDGIGYVFAENDPYSGIDCDGCRNPDTGEIEPWASKVIEVFGSYTEVSPSGTGVKIIVRGELPDKGRNTKHVEIYDRRRFFTLTGDVLGARMPITARQEALEALYARISPRSLREASEAPREVVPVALEDANLLEKARRAGNGAKFHRLYYEGDASGHSSESEADLDLMGMLAFWTGRDAERMERLFGGSALGQREKWRSRPDYRSSTVDRAARGCAKVYEGKKPRVPASAASDELRKLLNELQDAAVADPWAGRTGPSERWLYHALMNTCVVHGKPCDEGVVVAAASRDLALACGRRRQATERLMENLEERGRVRCIEKGQGKKASVYLLPRWGHKEDRRESESDDAHLPRWGHREAPSTKHTVFIYGPTSAAALPKLLAKVGNPAPQIDAEYDKNGQRILQESKFLLRPMGDSAALLVEKVAAYPGLDLAGLSEALGRPPSKVGRLLGPMVEGWFVFEDAGRYYVPGNLMELVEAHLEHAGCNYRERNRCRMYAQERVDYADDREREHQERLAEAARACGVEDPEIQEAPEPTIETFAEVLALARERFAPVEDQVTLPAAPGRDPLVKRGTDKARFFKGGWREARPRDFRFRAGGEE